MSAGPPGLASNPTTIASAAPVTPPAVNLPAGATSEPPVPIAEKVIGAGVVTLPNLATAQWAGPEVNGIAGLINVVIEYTKNLKWFPEAKLTIPLLIIISFAIAWLLWHDNIVEAISKGAWIVTQAHANWVGGKRLGLLAPTDPTKRFGN